MQCTILQWNEMREDKKYEMKWKGKEMKCSDIQCSDMQCNDMQCNAIQ